MSAPSANDELTQTEQTGGLLTLALLSLLAGAASGLLGACFRRTLEAADAWRNTFIAWTGESAFGASLVIAGTSAAAALAAWMVRRFSPEASGSGIPHVEAVLHKKVPPAGLILIPVKFIGGLLAIGAGLALGREGPSVQMGASTAELIGRACRLTAADSRILLAAGAGAGLATAFNAPIAGAVFVLEELLRRFDTRTTIATLGASTAAIATSRLILGQAPDFAIEPLAYPPFGSTPIYLVFGLVIGFVGMAYNRAILGCLQLASRLRRMPVEARAAAIGAAIGLLGWWMPQWIGGGDPVTSRALAGNVAISVLPAAIALRFALGAVSYSAGTPGGLFAPMLALGSLLGLYFGHYACAWFPQAGPGVTPYAVTGMAALFSAVVRAPVTGIILVVELTGGDTILLSMLAACFTAMLIPTLFGEPPIYESLAYRSSTDDDN